MKRAENILLKVCGMRDPGNIREVAALGIDYMGFIFYRGSKRFVGDNFTIPFDLPKHIKRVGIFVDEDMKEIKRLSQYYSLDYAQMHGDESADQCAAMKESGIKVIKAFSIDCEFDFTLINHFKSAVDYFLFDTKGKSYGGNGRPFDWAILNRYNQEVPFFLSGGLSADNISGVKDLKEMNLHGLDINSRVEIQPGLKDIELIEKVKSEIKAL